MIVRRFALMSALMLAFISPAAANPIEDFFSALFSVSGQSLGVVRASWYGGGERLNRYMANGQRFDRNAMVCAHRSLPFGTLLKVSRGAQSVVVVVADRGPARWTGRALDLSRAAAARLTMLGAGVARVTVQILR